MRYWCLFIQQKIRFHVVTNLTEKAWKFLHKLSMNLNCPCTTASAPRPHPPPSLFILLLLTLVGHTIGLIARENNVFGNIFGVLNNENNVLIIECALKFGDCNATGVAINDTINTTNTIGATGVAYNTTFNFAPTAVGLGVNK